MAWRKNNMFLDYETLRVIWWLLLAVLLTGFALFDGFDLGVGMLLPIVAKDDIEKRTLLNTIGAVWEGNQVWFILGGGAIFAAWPQLYAVSFSGFYLAMLVVLLALILRPVGFKYRSKLTCPKWRNAWDFALFIGGFVPALIFGVAVGNVLQGVPFHFTDDLIPHYTGSFLGLLNPFALLSGMLSVAMLATHGAGYLSVKLEAQLQARAQNVMQISSAVTFLLYLLAGVLLYFMIDGYAIQGQLSHAGPSNPLFKKVIQSSGAWFYNYQDCKYLLLLPIMGFIGSLIAFITAKKCPMTSFMGSSISIIGIIGSVGASMFPIILPSSSNPAQSLTVWDSSSSQLTLFIMLIMAVIFMPIVLAYTAWVYKVLSGKVTTDFVEKNKHELY
jgi:cytochrome d ubiquinol oxidase subunit II